MLLAVIPLSCPQTCVSLLPSSGKVEQLFEEEKSGPLVQLQPMLEKGVNTRNADDTPLYSLEHRNQAWSAVTVCDSMTPRTDVDEEWVMFQVLG